MLKERIKVQENQETESSVMTSLTKREREVTRANAIKELPLVRSRIKLKMTGLNLSEAKTESIIRSRTKAATAVMKKSQISSQREEVSTISPEVAAAREEDSTIFPEAAAAREEVSTIFPEAAAREEEADFSEELKVKLSEAPESKEAATEETEETEVDSETPTRIEVIKPFKIKSLID